jgi:thiamine biosynthesis lipoprotein
VSVEAHRSFDCFGGTATIHVRGTSTVSGEEAAELARERLLTAHRQLSRFSDESELTRLNRDPREEVQATPLLRALARAVVTTGSHSDGLVDATLLGGIEQAGYRQSLCDHRPLSLAEALASHPGRAPGKPHPSRHWDSIGVDDTAGTIIRPPGLRIDSGGIAKGLLADLLAAELGEHRTYAIDCCGDIRIGGSSGQERTVLVDDPFGGTPIHELRLRNGAVATSGISRRCWVAVDGKAAHHILDPSTGEPAFTGVVQVTALAPSALLAEVYAKAALLSGPKRAAEWLPHGGVLVRDDGEVDFFGVDRPLAEIAVAP